MFARASLQRKTKPDTVKEQMCKLRQLHAVKVFDLTLGDLPVRHSSMTTRTVTLD
jgi:hypothetical protein